MAIKSNEVIEAKDVRNRITSILDTIDSKINLIGNKVFFNNGTLSSSINSAVNRPEQTSNLIDKFSVLSNSFRFLSNDFNVKKGEIIYLKGFYEYAISCFAAASDIR